MLEDLGTMPASRAGAIILTAFACLGSSSLFVLAYAPAFFQHTDAYKLSLVLVGIGSAVFIANLLALMQFEVKPLDRSAPDVEQRLMTMVSAAASLSVIILTVASVPRLFYAGFGLRSSVVFVAVLTVVGPATELVAANRRRSLLTKCEQS